MNRAHLGELLVTQLPRLRRYARALTRNPDAADDLVQDAVERAWRKFDRWQAGSDLRAWLFTLMHNVYVNKLRRQKLQTEPMQQRNYPDFSATEPEQALRLHDLEAGLDRLSPEHREVLLLVCLEDMSYEQVAATLGIPLGTVMSRLHRSREKLRRWMDGEVEKMPVLKRIK